LRHEVRAQTVEQRAERGLELPRDTLRIADCGLRIPSQAPDVVREHGELRVATGVAQESLEAVAHAGEDIAQPRPAEAQAVAAVKSRAPSEESGAARAVPPAADPEGRHAAAQPPVSELRETQPTSSSSRAMPRQMRSA